MSDSKDNVINACKNVMKTASEHVAVMLNENKADITEIAIMKGMFDACVLMIDNLSDKCPPSAREKELFEEKNLCHSFLIQENMMTAFQSFKERKRGAK